MIAAREALETLKQGNARFVSGQAGRGAAETRARRDAGIEGQQPFAVILGCSDSRVPVEIVFDQNLGDLFVIRVAGNIAAPSQIGSVEFAAEAFGTQLVVVLGHTHCGAVQATIDELRRPSAERSPNLSAIVDRIRPAISDLVNEESGGDVEKLVADAVRANVLQAAQDLRKGSAIVAKLVARRQLHIVGAVYALETGKVEFFEPA